MRQAAVGLGFAFAHGLFGGRAVAAAAVERQLMPFDREARRSQSRELARAFMHIKYPQALRALEVVVVLMLGRLISRAVARQ